MLYRISAFVAIWMKRTENFFDVVLFIILSEVVLIFSLVKNSSTSGGTFYCAVKGDFYVCKWNPDVWEFIWKLESSTFRVVLFIILY